MKLFYTLFLFTLIPFFIKAQSTTSFSEYPLPQFSILLTDSATTYTKANLPKGKQVLVVLFSPDCDHCKKEVESIKKNIKDFKNTQVIMVTSQPFSKMKAFYREFELAKFKEITVGWDPRFFFPNYYKIKFFPFLAIYDKKYKYLKHFEGNPQWADLKAYL